jgi:uncharacterized protein (TIGR02246 family)
VEPVEIFEHLLTAWNKRDAAAFGALFAPDALMIGFDGSQVRGADIVAHLTPIFGDHLTPAYVAAVRGTRPIAADATLLWAIAGLVPPGRGDLDPALDSVQTLIVEGGRIVLFQNTPAQYHSRPDLAAKHHSDLLPALLDGATVI